MSAAPSCCRGVLSALCVVTFLSAFGCGGSGGGGTARLTPPDVVPGSALVRWESPTAYEDGTPIDPDMIAGYRLRWSLFPGACEDPAKIFVVDAAARAFRLHDLPNGIHFFSVSTLLENGVESRCSEEVDVLITEGG